MGKSRERTSQDDSPMFHCSVTQGTLSQVGRGRSSNEDSFCALVGGDAPSDIDALLAVADGMGGHRAGEVASRMAIRGLVAGLSCDNETFGPRNVFGSRLKRTFTELNTDIHTAAALPETRGMGTTLTAAVIAGGILAIGHVGDSRAYLFREGSIQQLTQDHSWVAEQMAKGLITSKEAKIHGARNIITRALGVASSVRVDALCEEIREGDLLLICSDGVHSLVSNEELARLLAGGGPQSSSREIVNLARTKGSNDDVTAVVGRIDSLGQYPGDESWTTSNQLPHDQSCV